MGKLKLKKQGLNNRDGGGVLTQEELESASGLEGALALCRLRRKRIDKRHAKLESLIAEGGIGDVMCAKRLIDDRLERMFEEYQAGH